MNEKYFVISCDEDGASIKILSKDELEESLAPEDGENFGDWGEVGFMDENSINENPNAFYWQDNILIIKGQIVDPKPLTVVKRFEV